jgi:hypothetical protein
MTRRAGTGQPPAPMAVSVPARPPSRQPRHPTAPGRPQPVTLRIHRTPSRHHRTTRYQPGRCPLTQSRPGRCPPGQCLLSRCGECRSHLLPRGTSGNRRRGREPAYPHPRPIRTPRRPDRPSRPHRAPSRRRPWRRRPPAIPRLPLATQRRIPAGPRCIQDSPRRITASPRRITVISGRHPGRRSCRHRPGPAPRRRGQARPRHRRCPAARHRPRPGRILGPTRRPAPSRPRGALCHRDRPRREGLSRREALSCREAHRRGTVRHLRARRRPG